MIANINYEMPHIQGKGVRYVGVGHRPSTPVNGLALDHIRGFWTWCEAQAVLSALFSAPLPPLTHEE